MVTIFEFTDCAGAQFWSDWTIRYSVVVVSAGGAKLRAVSPGRLVQPVPVSCCH